MFFKKEEKPSYLRYKEGKITEKERIVRLELKDALDEEKSEEDLVTERFGSGRKTTILKGVITTCVLAFCFISVRLIKTYTLELYGPRTEIATEHIQGVVGSEEEGFTLPEMDFTLDIPSLSTTKEKGALTEQVTPPRKAGLLSTSELEVFITTVGVHEDLYHSAQRMKRSVVEYLDKESTNLTYQSRIRKEVDLHAKLNETLLKTKEENTNKSIEALIDTLQSRVDALGSEAILLAEHERVGLVDVTNESIEAENKRRNNFLDQLIAFLDDNKVPYESIDGKLFF